MWPNSYTHQHFYAAIFILLTLLIQQRQHIAVVAAIKLDDTVAEAGWKQQQQQQQSTKNAKPNIIIILIDDMGFNDVSFHGSNQILTPNIDALAYNGIILNRHYVPNLCTPSRATLLTGKYPIHTGMQHFVILNDEPWGLPLGERLMPEIFRDAGYSTNLIGKWHLGFWRKELTPTMRGFDHHLGYYSGYIDYYSHRLHMLDRNYSSGLDFRRDLAPLPEANGIYATDLFTQEAERIISQHNVTEKPLFLLMSHLAVHTGNEDQPMQAPDEEVAKFAHIADAKRRTYAGMVSRLDRSVGRIMRSLSENNMLNNSIVLLYSDNGAPTVGIHSNAGSNYPFRGQKESPWEGALRSAGLIWSPLLQQRSYVSNQLAHAIDWLPTLASAAGVPLPTELQLDGINLWPMLSGRSEPQPRNLLHVLDDVFGYSAYTRGNLKYVNGSSFEGRFDTWLGDLPAAEQDPNTPHYVEQVLGSEVAHVLGAGTQLSSAHVEQLRAQATHRCPPNSEDYTLPLYRCEPLLAPCYFDLDADPCERYNLARLHPEQVQALALEVDQLRRSARPSARQPMPDANCDPGRHDGNWEWWYTTAGNSTDGGGGEQLQSANLLLLTVLSATVVLRRLI